MIELNLTDEQVGREARSQTGKARAQAAAGTEAAGVFATTRFICRVLFHYENLAELFLVTAFLSYNSHSTCPFKGYNSLVFSTFTVIRPSSKL